MAAGAYPVAGMPMTTVDITTTLNKTFREHRRYTGDGLPNQPSGAPLPVGDPSSGVHNPAKSDIRGAFADVQTALQTAVDAAEDSAEAAQEAEAATEAAVAQALTDIAAAEDSAVGLLEGLVNDAVSVSNVPIVGTRNGVEILTIPAGLGAIRTSGFAVMGDGGYAIYVRVNTEPTHAGKVRSADRFLPNGTTDAINGGWWELGTQEIDPRMFGAVGNGVNDDTDAISDMFEMANILDRGFYFKFSPGVYLCSPLPAITASGVVISASGATILVKPDSWLTTGHGSTHMDTGSSEVIGLKIDGNKAAFTTPAIGRLLEWGSGAKLRNLSACRSPYQGAITTGATDFELDFCHFDDNDNLGIEMGERCARGVLNHCTAVRNGGFGVATRFRSRQILVNGGSFSDNDLDGFNVNQGSHSIRFIGVCAHNNGDGGFTIAGDDFGTEIPGDGEFCRDISYVDCEAENNYTSGLAAYHQTDGLNVSGGRYFNNHRLAGNLEAATSFFCGVFVASGSRNVSVDTNCFDDRQIRAVTGVSGSGASRTIAATDWDDTFTTRYSKVAFYNANMVFLGYGNITADAPGTLTVSPTSYNGFTGSDIAANAKFVTQAVQHVGALFDGGCSGEAHVSGFGHLRGVPTAVATGRVIYLGPYGDGTNMRLPKAVVVPFELLSNPSFDADTTGWLYNLPGGGDESLHTGSFRRSAGALRLQGGTSDARADAVLVTDAVFACRDEAVTFEADVFSEKPGGAAIELYYGVAPDLVKTVVRHPGGTRNERLTITVAVPADADTLVARLVAAPSTQTFFDNLSLRPVTVPRNDLEFSKPFSALI